MSSVDFACERLTSVFTDACESRKFAPPAYVMRDMKADPDPSGTCSVCGLPIIGVAEVVEPLEHEAYLAAKELP